MEDCMLNRKERLIITAVEILDELGIQGLSTREIARRQEVSEATLFRHFKSKNELLAAVLDRFSQFDSDIYQSTRLKGLRPKKAITFLVSSLAEYYESYPAITSILNLFDVLSSDPELGGKVKNIFNKRACYVRQLVEDAKQAGEILEDTDSENLSSIIIGLFREICLKWRLEGREFSLKGKILSALEMVLGAFCRLSEENTSFPDNILDQISSLLWKTDANLECNYVNRAWCDFTGLSLQEALGRGWESTIYPDDFERFKVAVAEATGKRAPYKLEARFKRYDGENRWCLVTGAPYYRSGGQFEGYIGSVNDITERKEAEEALKASEEKFKIIFENAYDAFFVQELKSDILNSTFSEVNELACRYLGYSREELLSLSPASLLTPKSREYVSGLVKTVLKNEQSVFEVLLITKTGKYLPVEVSTHIFKWNEKNIILSVARSIEERKATQRQLMANQSKYSSLFMSMNSGVVYCRLIHNNDGDPVDFEYVEVNDKFGEMFGFNSSAVIGKRFSQVFKVSEEVYASEIKKYTLVGLSGGNSYLEDFYFEPTRRWYSVAISSSESDYFTAVVSDITERKINEIALKQAKEAAEAANRAKSVFLANMSHEIRTPINGIVGMIDLTLFTNLDAEQRSNLLTARTCANTLLKVINDVLDFSKMEAGKLAIENSTFNLKELMEQVIKTHLPRIADKGLELQFTFSPTIPHFLVGDPVRLRQVLNNLLSNAMKFTENGEITLGVRKLAEVNNETELKFTVSDTGIGIASEDIGRLFKSFSQVDGSFTKRFGGTGLGLAISKQLIEMMGGSIGVESEKGKGSTFYFTLKLPVGGQTVAKTGQTHKISKTLKSARVLVVEDDAVSRNVITKMLKAKGHSVDSAENGREALVLFEKKKYDVILMDIQMPIMDGVEAAKRIREMEGSERHTPIIAVTAYALKGDREKYLALGMDEYISKPIYMSKLFNMLDGVITWEKPEGSTPAGVEIAENGEVVFLGKDRKKPDKETTGALSAIAELIGEMSSAFKNGRFTSIESIAHRIKAISGEIAADEIRDAAFKVELGARRGSFDDTVFKENIDNLLKAYEEISASMREEKH